MELRCHPDIHRKISIHSTIALVFMTHLHGAKSVLGIVDVSSEMIILQEYIGVKSTTHHWGPPLAGPGPLVLLRCADWTTRSIP